MRLSDLVDLERLRDICESVTELTGAVTAVLDLDGNVLVATGWRAICTRFHRVHPSTAELCHESDTILAGRLRRGEPYNVYRCRNGLVDVAVPIIVGNQHVGNFFTGQFLFESPKREQFERQAEQHGFECGAYMAALDDVPVFSEAYVHQLMQFFSRLTGMIGDMGLDRQRARQSDERFSRAFERAPMLMSISRLADGTLLDANARFCELAGISREALRGQTWRSLDLLSEEDHQAILAALAAQGRVEGLDVRMRAADGRRLDLLFSGEVIHLDGEPRLLATGLDVTEQRRLESRLMQAEKMEAMGRLAGGVAHDFSNKLLVILGHAELAESGDDLALHLAEIRRAGESARDLARQLLTFSRRRASAPRPLDVNEAIGQMQTSLARLIGEDITVTFTPCEGPCTVRIDPVQLDQTLMNLAVNARDAMPEGGRVDIATDRVVLGAAACKGFAEARPGSFVRLAFRDSGSGIDEETLPHIFEPFFTTKALGRGTGLGLATVFGIVTQNHGILEVRSEEGRGTEFLVFLPVEDVVVPPVEPEPVGHDVARAWRVLLVEDEQPVRLLVKNMLLRLGCEVVEAASPHEAVEVAAAHAGEVDVVLTDVVMPGMSGQALAGRLESVLPGVPVLYMTGYASPSLEAEPAHLLRKPFKLAELRERLSNVRPAAAPSPRA